MKFIDPAYWDDEKDLGVNDLTLFIEFFKVTLETAGFDENKVSNFQDT